MKNSKYLKLLLLSTVASLFIACGGDSSSIPKEDNSTTAQVDEKVIANAGADQNITFGKQAILSAIGDAYSFEWSLNGTKVSEEKSFVMDNFPKEGSYKFDLKVSNAKGESSTDSLTILTFSDTVVKLKTNQGDISLEMKSSVAPKAVENFVTHSRNGYYNGIKFHRVIKDFMIQSGDPTGTGVGGESIWGTAFEDEFDSSVRFNKPYLLAMANKGKNTNASQFFITVVKTEFLNDKHTIFGEVIEGKDTVHKIEISGNSNSEIEKATVIFEIQK